MAGNSVCYASTVDLAMLGLPENLLELMGAELQQRHLEIASGQIDSYLRAQYKLPISQDETTGLYPPELVSACVDIASYSLIQFIGYNPSNGDDKYQQRFYDMTGNPNVTGSKGWLDRVRTGAVQLALAVDATPTTRDGAPQVNSQPARGWNIDNAGRANTKFI